MKKQQKILMFAGLLCLMCVSMSVTVGVLASQETEEIEDTSNTTPGGDCVGAWGEWGTVRKSVVTTRVKVHNREHIK